MAQSKQEYPIRTVGVYGFDLSAQFFTIVEIAKKLGLALKEEVSSVIGGIFTIGGMIIGGIIYGGRGATGGALIGANLAHGLCSNENFVNLAEYLLHKLPKYLREGLVKAFQTLLTPFAKLGEAVEKITNSPQLRSLFVKIMDMFLKNTNTQYRIAQ